MRSRPAAEALLVLSLSIAAAVLMTYPLAANLGHVGRVETPDGRWSIWVITWVARTLVADPRHVFDANIFYPHTETLAFSESNLGGGLLGVAVYWLTRNPYATHNFVLLAAFALAASGMYALARYLTGHPGASAVAAVTFAFCPYMFGHTAHIQLLMIAGLPFTMLAFHRVVDRPSAARGVVLALALVLQAISCGYYGVFDAVMVGFGVLFFAWTRRQWPASRYWGAVAIAAVLSVSLGALFYLPYLRLTDETGFTRQLGDARPYAADWRAYLASGARAHRWMLSLLGHWNEVLFPGITAGVLGVAGAGLVLVRAPRVSRDLIVFYALLMVLACWASFGPAAGLYTVLYKSVPMFSFLRAPSRFGALVIFALSVLTAFAVAWLVENRYPAPAGARGIRRHWLSAALVVVAFLELAVVPLAWHEAVPLPAPYRVLAGLPRGPVLEMPFFYRRQDYPRHTIYMLDSTYHWQPLVNGYSDFIPADFRQMVIPVSSFPSTEAFAALKSIAPRYVIFHMDLYNPINRERAEEGIAQFAPYLRLLARERDVSMYEIVGWP